MPKFKVIRQHLGDKMYMPGESRDAVQRDVQHLIDNGVLAEPPTKSEPPLPNKVAQPVKTNTGG